MVVITIYYFSGKWSNLHQTNTKYIIMSNNNAVIICEKLAGDLAKKASHNKAESLWSFKLTMILTLLTPIFITTSDDWLWGKLVPSVCAALASFLTAWIKLRKPESLWSLYRTGQRQIEKELRYYKSGITPYNGNESDKKLVENVSNIFDKTHAGWLKLVPNAEDLVTESSPDK